MKPSSLLFFALLASAGIVPSAHALLLLHSNDVMGDIEPCGCRGNPKGGMIRKEIFLKGLPQEELLQLDAGDLLFSTDSLPELLAGKSELQASYLLTALERLGLDAVVPGEKDFALGIETFQRLTSRTKIRFIGANLTKANGDEFLPPFLELTRKTAAGKTVKIGIIGLVGENLKWPSDLKIAPSLAAAKKWANKLRNRVDLLVALTHQGHDTDRALAEAVPELDLIIGGHSQAFLQKPVVIQSTLLLESAYRNQFIGILPLEAPFKKPLLSGQYRQVALDEFFDPPSKTETEMKKLVAAFKAKAAEIAIPLETQGQAQGQQQGQLQGSKHCAECHAKQTSFWKASAHFKTKPDSGKAANAECESCHAPGGDHPFSGTYSKNVPDSACSKCHGDGKLDRKKVSCPPEARIE